MLTSRGDALRRSQKFIFKFKYGTVEKPVYIGNEVAYLRNKRKLRKVHSCLNVLYILDVVYVKRTLILCSNSICIIIVLSLFHINSDSYYDYRY